MLRFVALLGACLVVRECAGQTIDTWRLPASGVWGTGSNWTDGTAPGVNNSATIGQTGTYTATLAAAPSAILSLRIDNGAKVTLQSAGGLRTLTTTNSTTLSTNE